MFWYKYICTRLNMYMPMIAHCICKAGLLALLETTALYYQAILVEYFPDWRLPKTTMVVSIPIYSRNMSKRLGWSCRCTPNFQEKHGKTHHLGLKKGNRP